MSETTTTNLTNKIKTKLTNKVNFLLIKRIKLRNKNTINYEIKKKYIF